MDHILHIETLHQWKLFPMIGLSASLRHDFSLASKIVVLCIEVVEFNTVKSCSPQILRQLY